MQRLQDTIDTLFADIDPKPRPIPPSDTAVLRDCRLVEVARKIQKLKEARLQAQSRQ
jgi:hypothetical protein